VRHLESNPHRLSLFQRIPEFDVTYSDDSCCSECICLGVPPTYLSERVIFILQVPRS
jgi:hypothetical protein